MNSKIMLLVIGVLVVAVGGFLLFKKKNVAPPVVVEQEVELPVNTIPVSERPFITLTPDTSGRNLSFAVVGVPQTGELEYELVYNSVEKQEGVFGRLNLESEKQPIAKQLLLGSKSGGGKVTYHEGVTGGSLTVTFGETRLKEQFNFLRFDPTDPIISSSDVYFHANFQTAAFKKDTVVIVMKSFGLPAALDESQKLVSGPYAYLAPSDPKGAVEVEIKLPAGEHVNPTMYEFDGSDWKKLTSKLVDDTVTASAGSGSTFIVTAE